MVAPQPMFFFLVSWFYPQKVVKDLLWLKLVVLPKMNHIYQEWFKLVVVALLPRNFRQSRPWRAVPSPTSEAESHWNPADAAGHAANTLRKFIDTRKKKQKTGGETRSPSSALLPFLFWEGSPTTVDYRKKGTNLF